jgi:hypothetical protein
MEIIHAALVAMKCLGCRKAAAEKIPEGLAIIINSAMSAPSDSAPDNVHLH